MSYSDPMAADGLSPEDLDALIDPLEAGLDALGVPAPLKTAHRLHAAVLSRTQDGKLVRVYKREAMLQLVEEAIEPLAGAALEHADELGQLKRVQDQILDLLLRLLLRESGPPGEGVTRSVSKRPRALGLIDFEAERSRHEHFFGRQDVLAELDDLAARQTRGWVVVTGGPGLGKSALLDRWLSRREDSGLKTAAHFIRRGNENWDQPSTIQANLAAQIEEMFPELEVEPTSSGRLARLLTQAPEPLVVLVDGLDEAMCVGDSDNPIPKIFPATLPEGVFVVVASRPRYPHLNWFKRRSSAVFTLNLAERLESNLEAVRAYWTSLGPTMEPPLTVEQTQAVITAASGNLLHAVKVRQLWERTGANRNPEAVPQGLEGVLYELWDQIGTHENKVMLRSGLSLLCAARESMPLRELEKLLGWDEDEGKDEFLPVAREMLLEQRWGKRSSYRPFHESMRELVASERSEAMRRSHETLVEFAAWPVLKGKTNAFRRRYALRHRIDHLVAAAHLADNEGDEDGATKWLVQAAATALDVEYLAAQACDGEVGLVEVERSLQLASTSQRDPQLRARLRALERAIEGSAHWLQREPAALPSLIHDQLLSNATDVHRALTWPAPDARYPRLRKPLQRLPSTSRVLEGHRDWVNAVAVLPDGRVVSGSHDNTVCVWDVDTGAADVLEGHQHRVRAVTVSSDGRVVSGSDDSTVRVWDLETGTCRVLEGHRGSIYAVATLPDGRVLSGSVDNTLRVWDLDTNASRVLQGHDGGVFAVAVLPDGRIVSGSRDKTIRVWNLETGVSRVLEGHGGEVYAVVVLPDGRIASGSHDKTLRVWDVETGVSRQLQGHGDFVNAVAVLADGRVVSGSFDKTVRVWDLDAGTSSVLEGHSQWVRAVAVLPDGRVVSGSGDCTLRVWDPDVATSHTLEGHEDRVYAVALAPDGRVVSGSFDRTLRVWDVDSGSSRVLSGHRGWVFTVGVLPDGRVVSGSQDNTVRVWNLGTNTSRVLEGHGGEVYSVAASPDGRVVSGSLDKTLRVWDTDAESGSSRVLEGHHLPVRAVAVLPDGRIVSGSADNTVRIWDVEAGTSRILRGHQDYVNAVAVSRDGRVVSGSSDKTLRVWDLDAGTSRVLEGHERPVNAVGVLADGRVVSGSSDNTLRIWDLESGSCSLVFGFTIFFSVATSPDLLVAGDAFGNVWFVDLPPPME